MAKELADQNIVNELISAIDNANDLCWATLSDNPDALKTLLTTKIARGLNLDINSRKASLTKQNNLRDQEANKYTVLDIAIMNYLAIKTNIKPESNRSFSDKISKIKELSGSVGKDEINHILSNDDEAKEVMKELRKDTILLGIFNDVSNLSDIDLITKLGDFAMNNMSEIVNAHETSKANNSVSASNAEKDIWMLLDNGAIGSEYSYFPDELSNPFDSNNNVEAKSLVDFCNENSDMFAKDLLNRITNGPEMPIPVFKPLAGTSPQ